MTRSDLERLRDARDFARFAQENAGELSSHALADARQPQHAALFDLGVIGETLNRVSSEFEAWHPIYLGSRLTICATLSCIPTGKSTLKSWPMSSRTGWIR